MSVCVCVCDGGVILYTHFISSFHCARSEIFRNQKRYCWGGSDRFVMVYRHYARNLYINTRTYYYIVFMTIYFQLMTVATDAAASPALKQFNASSRCNVFPLNFIENEMGSYIV